MYVTIKLVLRYNPIGIYYTKSLSECLKTFWNMFTIY